MMIGGGLLWGSPIVWLGYYPRETVALLLLLLLLLLEPSNRYQGVGSSRAGHRRSCVGGNHPDGCTAAVYTREQVSIEY